MVLVAGTCLRNENKFQEQRNKDPEISIESARICDELRARMSDFMKHCRSSPVKLGRGNATPERSNITKDEITNKD